MQRYMKAQAVAMGESENLFGVGAAALEINPDHPVVTALAAAVEADRHDVCLSGCETDVSPEYNVETCIAACAYWDGGTVQVLTELFDAGNPGPVLLLSLIHI